MKIPYRKCDDEQRKFIINSIVSRLDRKTKKNILTVRTKRKLCDAVYRDFLSIYGHGVDIKPRHIKNIVTSLNESKLYRIMSSGSPPGYVCIYGPNNPHADILKALECVERDKDAHVKAIETQVVQPSEFMAEIGIPSAMNNALAAKAYIRQISDSKPLEKILGILKGVESMTYKQKLIPERTEITKGA
jgi:hypothetical protein